MKRMVRIAALLLAAVLLCAGAMGQPVWVENLISEEDFAQLRDAVTAKTVEICRNLAEGNIDIHPMKTKERSACTYCEYKGICRFDTVFEGCSYNVVI